MNENQKKLLAEYILAENESNSYSAYALHDVKIGKELSDKCMIAYRACKDAGLEVKKSGKWGVKT
mgnify:CR=1 FL=1